MKINYQLFHHDGSLKSSTTFEAHVNPIDYELDPRTATGYFLRYLAQREGVEFSDLDTDEQVREKYFSKGVNKMSWKWEDKKDWTVRTGLTDRFLIRHQTLDYFSEEVQSQLGSCDYEKDSEGFAKALLSAIGDELTKQDLVNIIKECTSLLVPRGSK